MKILHVSKVYLPVRGGVQEVVHRLVSGLKRKFDFTVLSTRKSDEDDSDQEYRIRKSKALFEISSMPVSFTLLFSLYRESKSSSVVCFHYPFPILDFFCSVFPKPKLDRADGIVISSPGLLEHSVLLKPHKDKVELIPFGVKDIELPEPSYDLERKKLLCIGRHVHYKGYDVLLNAIVDIDCELTIVGDGPLLESHKRLAGDLGIADKVVFKIGLDDSQVEREILNTDVFVLPSRLPSEAFALVQIEALRAGKPVINTRLESGVPWVAKHDSEAITVEPENVDELAEAVDKLLKDDDLYARLSQAARDRYLKDFTLQHFLDKSAEFYSRLG